MKFKRIDLFKRLDPLCYKSLESAAVLCKTRGNAYIDLGHWLNQLLLSDHNDLHCAIEYFKLDSAHLAADLTAHLNSLQRGAPAIRDFSPAIETAIKEAWMVASIVQKSGAIRAGQLLIALKENADLCFKLHQISGEFKKINSSLLLDNFAAVVSGSTEEQQTAARQDSSTGQAAQLMSDPAMGKGEALALYCVDMTEKARQHEIDNIVGRDVEIRKIIDILLRRRQNNPIITGEAGVGKTAVVEGFAVRLANNDVPDALKGSRLMSLDLGLLQAGASMKGEFENRLKQVLEEVKGADVPTILFIDEAHTLIGAGGSAGQNDAANLLKPALARGQLRCIAATTYREYVKYFEKDPALTRRFENIMIDEPDDSRAYYMLLGMKGTLEEHHKVKILDEALHAAVRLSRRYIPTRQLPDKAVSVLDTACAKVCLSQTALPGSIEFLQRDLESLRYERSCLEKEVGEGFDHADDMAALDKKIEESGQKLSRLEEQLRQEKDISDKYFKLRAELGSEEAEGRPEQLRDLMKKLHEVQQDNPLILPEADAQAVAQVISEWTGIPLGRMVSDEIRGVLELKASLMESVKGQDHAMELLSRRIAVAKANLADPSRPIAVLMFAGPSGVGKTQTAQTLAEIMYGSEQNLITINMSEFQESHTVSTLKGAPPGYVGYGEGGVLTEAVRRKPYSVVLLDEVEKAHRDVHELFFQVFDKGRMEDGAGRLIDFRNTVILLTTNVGDDIITAMCEDEDHLPTQAELEEAIRPAMLKVFPAALLGRLNIIPFYPLGRKVLRQIIDLKLKKVVRRVRDNYKAEVVLDPSLFEEIISRCNNVASGARLIDAVINNDLLPDLGTSFLEAALDGKEIAAVELGAADGSFVCKVSSREA